MDASPEEEPLPRREPSGSGAAPQDTSALLREEAIGVARRLVDDLPDRSEPVALLALTHSRFRNTAEAVKCWQRCLELDPDFAGAYDALGRIALNKGEYEEAAAHFRKALAIAPELSEVRAVLADALLNLGKVEEAVAVLEEDRKVFPRNAASLFRLGKAHLLLKEYEKAKEDLAAAIEIDPACTDAHYGLSNVCARLGLRDDARKYRERFQQLKAADAAVSEGRRQALYQPQRLPPGAPAWRRRFRGVCHCLEQAVPWRA